MHGCPHDDVMHGIMTQSSQELAEAAGALTNNLSRSSSGLVGTQTHMLGLQQIRKARNFRMDEPNLIKERQLPAILY